jgi:hypothetical protein
MPQRGKSSNTSIWNHMSLAPCDGLEQREQYRYLVGCAPQWCYVYNQNKWYAIDPFIDYALHNTSPALASDIPLTSPGQGRLLAAAANTDFDQGSWSQPTAPLRYGSGAVLGTDEAPEHAERSFSQHRNLMRAFALELLEWWDGKLRIDSLEDLELDDLDIDLLYKAQEQATAEEAARELGITVSRVNSRYERAEPETRGDEQAARRRKGARTRSDQANIMTKARH